MTTLKLSGALTEGLRKALEEAPGVPLHFPTVQALDTYQLERMRVPEAAGSAFVFVNLFRAPLGAPMRLDAINEVVAVHPARPGQSRRGVPISCGTLSARMWPMLGQAST